MLFLRSFFAQTKVERRPRMRDAEHLESAYTQNQIHNFSDKEVTYV